MRRQKAADKQKEAGQQNVAETETETEKPKVDHSNEAYYSYFQKCQQIYPSNRIKDEHYIPFRNHITEIKSIDGRTEECERIITACELYVGGNKKGFDGMWFDKFIDGYNYEDIKHVERGLPHRVVKNPHSELD